MLNVIKRNFIYLDKHCFVLLYAYNAMVRPHLNMQNYIKRDIEIIVKVQKRATKLIISLKHLSSTERLKQLMLPMLKYRRLRGDVIKVFKIVHDFYHLEAAVKLNIITFRGSKDYRNFMSL